jgi:hypothetical protein
VAETPPTVVYHSAAMDGWRDVVREQMALLRYAGLTRAYATHVGGHENDLLEEAAHNGVTLKLDRADANVMHYETFAMLLIERLAKESDNPILYFHTKGVSASWHEGKTRWRRLMERLVVARWRENLTHLKDHDAVGVNWYACDTPHFSGNFWLARADWLRKLPDFVTYHNSRKLVRYTCEFWIGSAPGCRPRSLACSGQVFWADNYDFDSLGC